jgi:hypothetical protein
MRDPIDRAIAQMFQSIPTTLPYYLQLHEAGPHLVMLLCDVTIMSWRQELENLGLPRSPNDRPFGGYAYYADEFFLNEFVPITGIDVLRHPIDRTAGFTLLANGKSSVLLFRFEDIGQGLAAGLSALTGRREITLTNENTSAEKDYAHLYRDFRSKFKVPSDLCAAIYDRNRYVRHFYSEADIVRFKTRWSKGALNPETAD